MFKGHCQNGVTQTDIRPSYDSIKIEKMIFFKKEDKYTLDICKSLVRKTKINKVENFTCWRKDTVGTKGDIIPLACFLSDCSKQKLKKVV